jgi:hypothetical protein
MNKFVANDLSDDDRRKSPSAKGGYARVAKLSPLERKELAARASAQRWRKDIPVATHEGVIVFETGEIPCAVLPGELQVISGRVVRVLGGKRSVSRWKEMKEISDSAGLPAYLSDANLRPFVSRELVAALTPVVYRSKSSGATVRGLRAELLPEI